MGGGGGGGDGGEGVLLEKLFFYVGLLSVGRLAGLCEAVKFLTFTYLCFLQEL